MAEDVGYLPARESFARNAEMMTSVAIVFYLIARALYKELLDRNLTVP